jgi:hypothetical protein
MPISKNDLEKALHEWRANQGIFRIEIQFIQNGITNLTAVVSDFSIIDEELRILFGKKNVGGQVAIMLSDDVSIEWLDSKSGLPFSERCIQLTWKLYRPDEQRCVICLQKIT